MHAIGLGTEQSVTGREYLLDREHGHVVKKTIRIAHTATDTTHTGYTNVLRKGLAMGIITASGEYSEYIAGNSDGTETFYGFLDQEVDMRNDLGSAVDQHAVMVVSGRVDESETFGVDTAAKADAANGDNGCFFIWDD